MAPASASPTQPLALELRMALGLDAGGGGTRWHLRASDGGVVAEGTAPPLSGVLSMDEFGAAAVQAVLDGIAQRLPFAPHALVAGISGYDGSAAAQLLPRLSHAFGLPQSQVRAMSDIELLCRAAFAPGDGIVVYAGTGSIAAQLDGLGILHRAGGRGVLIDDAGGGHWIAREALRRIWRAEDVEPGAWQRSLMAHEVFAHIGGPDWAQTREWVYSATRGSLGALALSVAAAANRDAEAQAILDQAGRELARLALVLLRRFGRHPVALAGRVFQLHPAVERGLVAVLPPGTPITSQSEPPVQSAARLAVRLALSGKFD